MGIPSRAPGTPYVDGQTLGSDRLEVDFANIVAEMGNIENVNIAAGADISGTKLADDSIPTAAYAATSITRAKLGLGAAMKQATGYTAGQLTLTTSYADAIQATVTTGTPVGVVFVFFRCLLNIPNSATGAITCKLFRGATELTTRTLFGSNGTTAINPPSSAFFVDTGAAAATPTIYKVQAQKASGSGAVLMFEREIFVIELAQ